MQNSSSAHAILLTKLLYDSCHPTESTIVSEGFKGGTRGAPIMPRDAVSRTANVERNGVQKWVKEVSTTIFMEKCSRKEFYILEECKGGCFLEECKGGCIVTDQGPDWKYFT